MMMPFNFKNWLEENQDSLKPPVCNKLIFKDSEFIAMAVGGPNSRTDYHVDESEEIFFQVKGDMILKIIEDGQPKDIKIKEGDTFLLPKLVPHSPQRFENTVGIVIERTRRPEEKDGFQWFCPECHNKIYEEFFHVSDIVKQLPECFERFYGSEENRTCKSCGYIMDKK